MSERRANRNLVVRGFRRSTRIVFNSICEPDFSRLPRQMVSWKLLYAYAGDLYALNINGVSPDPRVAASLTPGQTAKANPNNSRAIRIKTPALTHQP